MKSKDQPSDLNRIPTQAVVARAAGVSQQTVSQVLNGTGRISDRVRRHVVGTADKLGYRPNRVALALRENIHGAIGLVGLGDNHRSFIPNVLMQHLQLSLLKIRKHLSLVPVRPDEIESLKENPARLGIDGAFVSITKGDVNPMRGVFQSAGIPEIWLNSKQAHNCVYPDDYNASFQATSYLISQGRKGIGYVGFSLWQDIDREDRHYSVKDRHMGYKDAMTKAGLRDMHLIIGEMTTDSLLSFMRMAGPSPSLLCYEVSMALRVLLIAKAAGIGIPGELNIIYFHEAPFWDNALDELVRCIPVPNDRLAGAAVEMFLQKNNSKAGNSKSVPVQYDSKYFKHLLTNRSYFDVVKEA